MVEELEGSLLRCRIFRGAERVRGKEMTVTVECSLLTRHCTALGTSYEHVFGRINQNIAIGIRG